MGGGRWKQREEEGMRERKEKETKDETNSLDKI